MTMAGPRASGLKDEPIDLTLSDSDDVPVPPRLAAVNPSDVIHVDSDSDQAGVKLDGGGADALRVKEEEAGPSKRFRESDGNGPSFMPKRARQSARKTTQYHGSSLARRRKSETIGTRQDDSMVDETHESAMQRAAAERRRSTSGRPRTVSPVKPNAIAGPGPRTVVQQPIVVDTDSAPETIPSRPASSSSQREISKPDLNTPVPYPATATAPRKSAFVATDEPGSWSHAVPMGRQRPKTTVSTPVSPPASSSPAPAPGDWGNAVPMVIGKGKAKQQKKEVDGDEETATATTSSVALGPASSSTVVAPPSSPPLDISFEATIRIPNGPTWVTTAPVTMYPVEPTDNTAASDSATMSLLAQSRAGQESTPLAQQNNESSPANAASLSDVVDDPPPVFPDVQAVIAEEETDDQATLMESAPQQQSHKLPMEVDELSSPLAEPPEPLELPPEIGCDATIDAGANASLPLANATTEEVEAAIESIEEGVHEVALDRQARSVSSSSIEVIPAEIARSQAVFAARNSARGQPATAPVTIQDLFQDSSSPPRRTRRSAKASRQTSASSSSSGSPSKRQSSRLKSKSLQPVYSWRRNNYDPIQWRRVVELNGEVLPEDDSSWVKLVDETEGVIRELKPSEIVIEGPTPPDRLSRAIRIPDTRLIDEWHRRAPELTNNPALHRLIFESYIDDSVGGDEPSIGVYNAVDWEPVPPRFEFQYSNEMLYHKDVPDPELGKGCGCDGPCSDNSKTCSCLARQRAYNFDVIDGFAYDAGGHLKNGHIAIWECGPNCGCPPECMNRVVQRGRDRTTIVDLFKTKKKGWGIRARNSIPEGTFMGVYSGELLTEAESEKRGILYSQTGRTYLFDCDGHQIHTPPEGLEEIDPRLAELAAAAKSRADLARQKQIDSGDYDENDFTYNAYSVDAYHRGNFTRYFNHSCDPNLVIVQAYAYDFHPERPLLVVFTRQPIRAGEELCISYKGLPDEQEVVTVKHRNGKTKKTKTKMANAHVARRKNGLPNQCFCGTWACDGVMFGP